MAAMADAGDVLDLLYDVVRKPPTAERAAGTHCLVTAALIKLVTRWGGTLGGRFQPRKKTRDFIKKLMGFFSNKGWI